jgi:hypothetical protein
MLPMPRQALGPVAWLDPILILTSHYRTVPTQEDILVPETLLKKRKSQEKAREAKLAEIEKRKAVSTTAHTPSPLARDAQQLCD